MPTLADTRRTKDELFGGASVCLHSDPRVGGLKPGEMKTIHDKRYVPTNDVPMLLRRYRQDFPVTQTRLRK